MPPWIEQCSPLSKGCTTATFLPTGKVVEVHVAAFQYASALAQSRADLGAVVRDGEAYRPVINHDLFMGVDSSRWFEASRKSASFE